MSITTEQPQDTAGSPARDARRTRFRGVLNLALAALVLVVGGLLVLRGPGQMAHHSPPTTPRSSSMEKLTGVRFSRVVVVGDGGLVTAFYVVVDPEKATQFQADRDHPPRLASESRDGGTPAHRSCGPVT